MSLSQFSKNKKKEKICNLKFAIFFKYPDLKNDICSFLSNKDRENLWNMKEYSRLWPMDGDVIINKLTYGLVTAESFARSFSLYM